MRTLLVVAALLALAFVAGPVPPAGAGGAAWYVDRDSYRPGDLVRAGTGVSWAHNAELGTPEDGPYGVWIIASDRLAALHDEHPEAPYPWIPEEAVPVGDVTVHDGPFEVTPGFRVGPNAATIEFTLPDVPPGQYQILHCDDPCTTLLGDILGGYFVVVGDEPAAAVPDTTAAPVTTTAAPTTTAPTTTDPGTEAPSRAEPTTTVPTTASTAPVEPAVAISTGAAGGGWTGERTAAVAFGGTAVVGLVGALVARQRR